MLTVTAKGAACNATTVHFGSTIKRTDILVSNFLQFPKRHLTTFSIFLINSDTWYLLVNTRRPSAQTVALAFKAISIQKKCIHFQQTNWLWKSVQPIGYTRAIKARRLVANLEDSSDFSIECRPISGAEDTVRANDELAPSSSQLRIQTIQ